MSACGPATAPAISLQRLVWRADQMSACHAHALASGHARLDRELPNGGWPNSVLIELLQQQPGIGELRLLRPALRQIAQRRRVALLQPPHVPQAAAWAAWGMAAERLLWVKTARSADALWTAEQILRNGSCGALLFWQMQVRPEALRRLHLAAQAADVFFWIMRPLAAAHEPSPAPLRLALKPAPRGLHIGVVKRRGPHCDDLLFVPFDELGTLSRPVSRFDHAALDRRVPAPVAAGGLASALV